MKRILKWSVPVDDQPHKIGSGRVIHVECQKSPYEVQIWTEEKSGNLNMIDVQIVGTGHEYSDGGVAVGSVVLDLGIVWHVIRFEGFT